MNSVGFLINSASTFENGGRLSRVCPIRVNALSRSCCCGVSGGRAHAPWPSIVSKKNFIPPSISPAAIFLAAAAILAASGEGPGFAGIERDIELAAGFGQDQLAQQIGPLLRDAKRDVTAAGMPHQIHRAESSCSMKAITSATCCAIE